MKDIALVTVIFDYPETFQPSFYKRAINFFNVEDVHIIRRNDLIDKGSPLFRKLYYYKIVELRKYIIDNILGKYEFMLFLDGTDTNFITSPSNLIEKFKKLNCSILMGAEKVLWPHTNYIHLYGEKPILTEYRYLNSGTYIGFVNKILEHIDVIIEKNYCPDRDDQGHWSVEYLHSDDIQIDQKCDFFFSTLNSKDKIIENNGEYTLDSVSAYIVHDNGPSNEQTIKLTRYYNEIT